MDRTLRTATAKSATSIPERDAYCAYGTTAPCNLRWRSCRHKYYTRFQKNSIADVSLSELEFGWGADSNQHTCLEWFQNDQIRRPTERALRSARGVLSKLLRRRPRPHSFIWSKCGFSLQMSLR